MIQRYARLKRTPIKKKRSKPRRGEPTKEEKAAIGMRVYQESGGRCELNLLPGCIKGVLPREGFTPWDHWHLVHRKSLGSGGDWSRKNLCGGCHVCHLVALHQYGGSNKPVPPKVQNLE